MKILNGSPFLSFSSRKLFGKAKSWVRKNIGQKAVRFVLPHSPRQMLYTAVIYQVDVAFPHSYKRWGDGFFSIEVIHEGELHVRNGKRFYLAEAGDIFLMQPGMFTGFSVPKGSSCRKTAVAFGGPLIPSFLKASGLKSMDILQGRSQNEICSIIRNLIELAQSSGAKAEMRNEIETYRLFQLLLQGKETDQIPEQYALLYKKLLANPEKAVSVPDMAKFCSCSESLFSKRFKAFFHQTPHQFLLDLRMRQSVTLLLETDLPIKEISERCGFSNQLQFSAVFSKKYGIPPKKYRIEKIPFRK